MKSPTENAIVEDASPMLVIQRDHRVSYANHKAHVLFGYGHGVLHGMSIEEVLAPSRRKEVRNVQAALRGWGQRGWRSAARLADGSEIDVHLCVEPCLDEDDNVVAVTLRCEHIVRPRRTRPVSAATSNLRLIRHLAPAPTAKSYVGNRAMLAVCHDGEERLEAALERLERLRQQLELSRAEGDTASDRACMFALLSEATELVAQCRAAARRELAAR